MKTKLLALALALLCPVLCTGALSASAESPFADSAQAQEIADSILQSAQDSGSAQEWLDTTLCAQAGTGAEWYVLCLAQSGHDYDFSAYESALLTYLASNTVPSATTKQKYALVLAAIGSTDAYISSTADSTVGSLGIMSYVYGLHLAHNGYHTPMPADQIISEILSVQNRDGGWAISGTVSDADVTAMTLQALAPYHDTHPEVGAAVSRALSLLSEKQTARGGFVSYGVENPESAAQVVVALCALGIDPMTDPRFIKQENTLFDAIALFSLGNGGYAHTEGGAYSAQAGAQVLCAATAYLRASRGQVPLYTLDRARPDQVQTLPESERESESENAAAPLPSVPQKQPLSYKPVACAIVLLLGAGGVILLIACKKTHYKNFIALALAVCVLLAAVILIDVRRPKDYYNGEELTKSNPVGTVTLTVRCDAVPGLDQIDHLPNDGILLSAKTVEIEAGETVYDILVQAARAYGLHVDAGGMGESVYVRGIGYLYEQEHGALSGWNYRVNGSIPSMGCGAYSLSDGDEIVWEYTLTVGK